MEVEPSPQPSYNKTLEISTDPDQQSAADILATLHSTDRTVSPAPNEAAVTRELIVGIFEEAAKGLKSFSPPRNVHNSRPGPDNYLDDPQNFNDDIQLSPIAHPTHAANPTHAIESSVPSAAHSGHGSSAEGMFLLRCTTLLFCVYLIFTIFILISLGDITLCDPQRHSRILRF